jgi:adenylate cyclase
MARLVLDGNVSAGHAEFELTLGESVRIGRKPPQGFEVSWDRKISREHADVLWNGRMLSVVCLPDARNPIQIDGQLLRQANIPPGRPFFIGETEFVVQADPGDADILQSDATERSFHQQDLESFRFRDADQQIELLSRLPRIMDDSPGDDEFAGRLVELLLEGVPRAEAAAVVQYELTPEDREASRVSQLTDKPSMMRVATRDKFEGSFLASRTLVLSALTKRESISHLWDDEPGRSGSSPAEFTLTEGVNWAFCTPILADSCNGWCLYVSGKGTGEVTHESLGGDLRFAELMAQFIGSVRHMRVLEGQKTQFSSFFSPSVVESLTGKTVSLDPEERDISVLFCDVRGFSLKVEKFRDDLHSLLRCVKEALAVMANGILDGEGTIADFQGDAALGFWGWPLKLDEGPMQACRAALVVLAEFQKGNCRGGLLEGFSVGIGIAHGNALAGQIGTPRQAKVGVFGPIVNQGARLETMTKQYGVQICVDEATADYCRQFLKPGEGRLRKLARVRPKGMQEPLTVSELLPPVDMPGSPSDEYVGDFEAAVDAVIAGNWDEAIAKLQSLPDDGPRSFLEARMAEHDNAPPDDWDGAFSLAEK